MKKFFLGIFTILLLTSCNKEKPDESSKAIIPVKTVKVVNEYIMPVIETSGKVQSENEMKLSFKTGGLIKTIYVQEGDAVKAGQVLAELDLSEISAQVNQARRGLEKAKRDYSRAENLYGDSVATLEQLQNAETALSVAQSNLEIAEFNLKYSKITAPSSGVILKKLAEINELVSNGFPIFLFGNTNGNFVIKAGVTDKDIVRISVNDKAEIKLDAYPNIVFSGVVKKTGQFADPYSGTYEIEISINSKGYKLISGFVAEIKIFSSQKQKAGRIPVESLKDANKNKGFIFKVKDSDGGVEKLEVEICGIRNDAIYICSGIKENEEIITEGAAYLNTDSKVKVIN